ncbi:hypothetical protein 2 [Beihai razor shell virus 3]|uniref:hypothetical protein 2 n=1 Tax=Beihai razor shell virus 3 TaxID=1922647 RepID=UPI00090CBC4E|nr:hypothetical protein 2 [Beihai razor shell virus 3]APG75690.1 hypothetical protein 2 [Beihai razor shell virus 3]
MPEGWQRPPKGKYARDAMLGSLEWHLEQNQRARSQCQSVPTSALSDIGGRVAATYCKQQELCRNLCQQGCWLQSASGEPIAVRKGSRGSQRDGAQHQPVGQSFFSSEAEDGCDEGVLQFLGFTGSGQRIGPDQRFAEINGAIACEIEHHECCKTETEERECCQQVEAGRALDTERVTRLDDYSLGFRSLVSDVARSWGASGVDDAGVAATIDEIVATYPCLRDAAVFGRFLGSRFGNERVLNPLSTPGVEWRLFGADNQTVFGYDAFFGEYNGVHVEDLRCAVIEKILRLIDGPHLDRIHTFLKDEPHKPEKVAEGRWRIISGVSATDQIACHLLMGEVLSSFSATPLTSGTAIGWNVMMHGGLSSIFSLLPFGETGKLVSADRKSWDWTVQKLAVVLFTAFALLLLDYKTQWERKAIVNHICSIFAIRRFDCQGRVVRFDNFGVLLSGWKFTALFNSVVQHLYHMLACSMLSLNGRLPLSMGDDTVQEEMPQSYWDHLATFGVILKPTETFDEGFEFCGAHFKVNSFSPVYLPKHAYNLRDVSPENLPALLISYRYLYMFDERRFNALNRWACEMGFDSLDRSELIFKVLGVSEMSEVMV